MWRIASLAVWRGYGETVQLPGGDNLTVRQVSEIKKQCATCRRVIGKGSLYIDIWNAGERHRVFCVNHSPTVIETRAGG